MYVNVTCQKFALILWRVNFVRVVNMLRYIPIIRYVTDLLTQNNTEVVNFQSKKMPWYPPPCILQVPPTPTIHQYFMEIIMLAWWWKFLTCHYVMKLEHPCTPVVCCTLTDCCFSSAYFSLPSHSHSTPAAAFFMSLFSTVRSFFSSAIADSLFLICFPFSLSKAKVHSVLHAFNFSSSSRARCSILTRIGIALHWAICEGLNFVIFQVNSTVQTWGRRVRWVFLCQGMLLGLWYWLTLYQTMSSCILWPYSTLEDTHYNLLFQTNRSPETISVAVRCLLCCHYIYI